MRPLSSETDVFASTRDGRCDVVSFTRRNTSGDDALVQSVLDQLPPRSSELISSRIPVGSACSELNGCSAHENSHPSPAQPRAAAQVSGAPRMYERVPRLAVDTV